MERSHQKIVKFMFCKWCVNKDLDEINEPCAECLEYPVNWDSVRPIHFKPNNDFSKQFKKGENND